VKVSKSNVSLFQLQASVLGTKDIESGLWATPNTMDYLPPRSAAGTKKIMEGHRKGRTKPSNLREQVDPETMKIYQDMGQVEKHLRSKKQSFPTPTTFDSNEINKPRKPHPGGGQKPPLNQVVKMYPTPTATERSGINPKTGKGAGLSKMVKMMYPTPTQDSASERTKKYKQGGKPLTVAVQEEEKKKMYPTPRASAAMNENLETVKKRVERRGKLGSKLEETIATEQPMMYPTPTVVCEEGGEQSHMVERTKSGGFVSRRKGTGVTYGAKLSDAMLYLEKEKEMYPTPSTRDYKGGSGTIKEKDGKYYRQSNTTGTKYGVRLDALMEYKEKMYPTPAQRDYKDVTLSESYKNRNSDSLPIKMMKKNKPGGKLNPTFVEFLMGFPMNWTKTEPTESKPSVTQSSHKSQGSSDSQSKKFYPTPRANEPGRTTKGYGRGLAELMEGKEQVEPKK
jgi:hypothetical protein